MSTASTVGLISNWRGAILAGFLARPVLYGTLALRQRFEARARTNLQSALSGLAPPTLP